MSLPTNLLSLLPAPLLGVTATEPAGRTEIGIGAVALTIVIAAFLVWVGFLVITSRRKRRAEETPKNLQPWLSDDALENANLTRVLSSAVIAAAVLAVLLPVYYLNESGRQAKAAESFEELYVHEGGEWFEKFECSDCHGEDGSGSRAEFIEPRSGLTVRWAAPSLNDVMFRYSEEEIRFWIEFGRPGTPMPPAGLEGGGAMTVQEVDQVLAFIGSLQLSQAEAFDKVEGAISVALARIETGVATVALAIAVQQAVIEDINDAAGQFAIIESFPDHVIGLLTGDGTCTDASAALVGSSCGAAGLDSDGDGVTDFTELELMNGLSSIIDDTVIIRRVVVGVDGLLSIELIHNPDPSFDGLYGIELDPDDAFTMADASGDPVADLATVDAFRRALNSIHLRLRVTTEREERFLTAAEKGFDALEDAAGERAWEVDFDAVVAATGLSLDQAQRAVGLFNAYCARCHTSGYNAGVAFEQAPGSGAWAPALTGGRSIVQFPDEADQIAFVIRGSSLAEPYGTNGLGRGWMPAFGLILSQEDIALIVEFERSL